MDLNDLRNEIDTIDNELVQLFVKRMAVSAKVAEYKKENNLPIYVPAREQEILMDIAEKAGLEMSNYARILYSMLFELSRNYQKKRNTDISPLYQQITDSIKYTNSFLPQSPSSANRSCEELYNLMSLATSNQDENNSHIRFISISKNLGIYPDSDKTCIMMILPNKPDALYKALARLYILGVNISKLESRPIPNRDLELMFYFELKLSINSDEFVQLVCELNNLSEELKSFKSYAEVVK